MFFLYNVIWGNYTGVLIRVILNNILSPWMQLLISLGISNENKWRCQLRWADSSDGRAVAACVINKWAMKLCRLSLYNLAGVPPMFGFFKWLFFNHCFESFPCQDKGLLGQSQQLWLHHISSDWRISYLAD